MFFHLPLNNEGKKGGELESAALPIQEPQSPDDCCAPVLYRSTQYCSSKRREELA